MEYIIVLAVIAYGIRRILNLPLPDAGAQIAAFDLSIDQMISDPPVTPAVSELSGQLQAAAARIASSYGDCARNARGNPAKDHDLNKAANTIWSQVLRQADIHYGTRTVDAALRQLNRKRGLFSATAP